MASSKELILSTRPLCGLSINKQNLNSEYFSRFQDPENVRQIFENAAKHDFKAIMTLSEPALMPELRRAHHNDGIEIYPIIPNMASYVREASDYGIVGAGIRRLRRIGLGNLVRLAFTNCLKAPGILKRDFNTAMSILFDVEMAEFRAFSPKTIFLHPQVTDLALANNNIALLANFADVIRKRYGAEPAVMTFNMGTLLNKIQTFGINIKVISAPFNTTGGIMIPSKSECEKLLKDVNIRFIADRIASTVGLDSASLKYLDENGIKSLVVDTVDEAEMKLAHDAFNGVGLALGEAGT